MMALPKIASKQYGPVATPHIFIFDSSRKLRYQGRIDDTEDPAKTPQSFDALNAIDALLAGKKYLCLQPRCSAALSNGSKRRFG
jgi:hypothetical protein